MSDVEQNDIDSTLARLHRFHDAVLRIGERIEPARFVVDAVTGRPVLPAPPGALEEETLVLHVPEDAADALHVMGHAVEIDPSREEACDRYLMYFGHSEWAHWMAIDIESVKNHDIVLDGSEAVVPNPLHRAEPGFCKRLNASAPILAEICRRSLGTAPAAPMLVGVDPYGLDVRARFGVVRVEFSRPARTPDEAAAAIDAIVRGASTPPEQE